MIKLYSTDLKQFYPLLIWLVFLRRSWQQVPTFPQYQLLLTQFNSNSIKVMICCLRGAYWLQYDVLANVLISG